MKVSPFLILAASLLASVLRAAVPITGTGTYSQNFNALGTGSTTWSQGSTVNSWHIHRTATTPPASLNASDGSGAFVGGAYNLGVSGSADRSLGSAPNTANGSYSKVLILQNTGSTAMQITRVAYSMEVYRTNQFLTTLEPVNFSYQTAATESALTAALAAAGALTGYTADAGLSMTLAFNGAGMPAVVGQVSPPVAFTRSSAPAAAVLVNPGQFIALRWEDINENVSFDCYMGLDDVTVEYRPGLCSITPEVINLQRQHNGTPSLLTDDTWSFDLRVTGVGTGSLGWNAAALGAGGSYGSVIPFSYPVSVLSRSVEVNDVLFPTCTAQFTVNAPPPAIAFVRPDRPQGITFSGATLGARSYVRTSAHPDLGWNWPGSITATAVKFQPGSAANPALYFDFNGSNSSAPLTTEPVNLTESGGPVRVRVRVAAYTNSDTGMEDSDTLTITARLGTDAAMSSVTSTHTLLAAQPGTITFNAIRIADPGINYGTVAGETPYPATAFPFVEYVATLPAGAGPYASVAVSGLNNSGSEHWLVDSITFETALCEVTTTVSQVLRSNPLGNNYAPQDDVFTARIGVHNSVPGPTGGWVSGSLSGAYVAQGSSTGAVFGPWPVSGGPLTVTIADANNAACFANVTIAPPPRLVFGTVEARGVTLPLSTEGGHLRWKSDETARTLEMDRATRPLTETDENAIQSQPLALPGSGPLYVSGILEAYENSAGSNWEINDFIRLSVLCFTPGGQQTVPLLARYDRDGNSELAGYTTAEHPADLVEYQANVQFDEFNLRGRHYSETLTDRFMIYGVLPADTTSISLHIAGRNGGGNASPSTERFTLSEIRITSTPPRAGLDWDHDGQFDIDEFLTGTDPFDASSLTRFLTSSATSAEGNFSFDGTMQTASGVHYGLYASSNLTAWQLLGAPVAGDGTVKAISFSDDESAPHTFFKVIARADTAFPATLP